jgi:hypothetical protein
MDASVGGGWTPLLVGWTGDVFYCTGAALDWMGSALFCVIRHWRRKSVWNMYSIDICILLHHVFYCTRAEPIQSGAVLHWMGSALFCVIAGCYGAGGGISFAENYGLTEIYGPNSVLCTNIECFLGCDTVAS